MNALKFAILLIGLVARGIALTEQVVSVAKKVDAGETITDAELAAAETEVNAAVAAWDEAKKNEANGQPTES